MDPSEVIRASSLFFESNASAGSPFPPNPNSIMAPAGSDDSPPHDTAVVVDGPQLASSHDGQPRPAIPKNAQGRKPKLARSSVWSYFERRQVEGGRVLAFCLVDGCLKKAGYKCGSTTSPMIKHLRDQHPYVWQDGGGGCASPMTGVKRTCHSSTSGSSKLNNGTGGSGEGEITARQHSSDPCAISTSSSSSSKSTNRNPLPPKKRGKHVPSSVWSFFERRQVEGGQVLSFCLVKGCHKLGGYKCGSTTTPLIKHMKDCHSKLWGGGGGGGSAGGGGDLVVDGKPGRTAKMEARQAKLAKLPNNKKAPAAISSQFEAKAVKWVVMNNLPLTIFDDPYWRDMVISLNSRAPEIKRAAVNERLETSEAAVRVTVAEMLQENSSSTGTSGGVSCTSDVWRSSKNEWFVSFTGHFIDRSWDLKSLSLGCVPFPARGHADPGPAIAVEVARKLRDVLEGLGAKDCESLVEAFVCDNAANLGDAGFSEKSGGRKICRNSCMAHALDFVAGKMLNTPAVLATLDEARGIVEYFKHSPAATSELNDVARSLEVKPRALKQDNSTHWSSTYNVCTTLQHMKPALQAMFTAQSLARQLTEVQWDAIEQCSRVLQPFAGAQSFLEEGDQFVGLSYVPSIVASLRHHLDDMISDKPHPKPNQQQKQQQLLLQRSDDAVRQAAILVRAAFYERYLGAAHGTTTTTGDDGAERRGGGGGGDDECHSRMPESALLAAQVDPRTKFFEGIGVNSSDRALELLKARMIRRQQQEEEGAKVEAARQQALVADAAAAAAAQKKKNGHAENGKEGGQRQQQEGKGNTAGKGREREAAGGSTDGNDDDRPASRKAYLQRMVAELRKRFTPGTAGPKQEQEDEGRDVAQQVAAEQAAVHESERRRELTVFLNPRLCPAIEASEDPLSWWKTNELRFPLIAHVARSVLATPAAATPSSRLFAQSGLVVSSRRDRLPAERLEQLMFLRGSWAAAEEYKHTKAKIRQSEKILMKQSQI